MDEMNDFDGRYDDLHPAVVRKAYELSGPGGENVEALIQDGEDQMLVDTVLHGRTTRTALRRTMRMLTRRDAGTRFPFLTDAEQSA